VSGDGYAEYTVTTPGADIVFGLGGNNTESSLTDVEWGLLANSATGELEVYESGVSRGGVGGYAAGDRLRVGVEAGEVKYYRNGVLLYTSTVPPTYPLLVDASLYSTGATIVDAVFRGNLADNVRWAATVNVTATGNTLTRPSGTAGTPERSRRRRSCPGTDTRSRR